ncbi:MULTISPECIES: beta-ketoacyl synthase N-terminal-like domain-containing protein [unclassified Streptomyces]|uniref:beta-ketoacyl synthase N-terminal-like domain-containing protein n=1 Tax=unclassified Streptomyces TaxID=2593676 RepID=UPI003369BDC3
MSDDPNCSSRTYISGWSAVSPFGIGRPAFSEGLHAGRKTAAPPDPEEWQTVPDTNICLVPDFNIREVLGKSGTRILGRESALAVTAVRELFHEAPEEAPIHGGRNTAMVMGTTTGTPQTYMDFTKASLTGPKPHHVPAALTPNMVMNRAASASAIWHQLQGPNSTIAGGRAAVLLALKYGQRLLRHRRADRVLCGGVEEYSNARSWLEYHRRGGGDVVLGEGCALLLLETEASLASGHRPALAEVLALEFRVNTDDDLTGALSACLHGALAAAKATADDVWAVTPSGMAGPAGEEENRLLGSLFDSAALSRVSVSDLIGDTSAASAGFDIIGMLSAASESPESVGRLGVVSSVDPDGSVACAIIRLLEGVRQNQH